MHFLLLKYLAREFVLKQSFGKMQTAASNFLNSTIQDLLPQLSAQGVTCSSSVQASDEQRMAERWLSGEIGKYACQGSFACDSSKYGDGSTSLRLDQY